MKSTFPSPLALQFLVAIAAAGCAAPLPPRFVEPEAAKPHAAVTIRVTYDSRPDEHSDERVTINGLIVDVPEGNRRAAGLSFGFRAPPGTARWQLGTSFYHFETRMVTETYLGYESTYDSCASRDSRGNCSSGTKMRAVTKTRTVPRTVRVDSASCAQLADYRFEAGATYSLALKFSGDERCALECREQSSGSDGSLQDVPCKAAPIGFTPDTSENVAEAKAQSGGTGSRPLRSVGTASIALGAIGLASAAVAGTYAIAMKREVNDHCDSDHTCDADGHDAAEKGRTAVKISTASGIAGAALLAGGIVLLNVGPREKPPTASLTATPTDRGGQISIKGAF